MMRVMFLSLIAALQLCAAPVAAESWAKRLTRNETGDQMYSFTIKVRRLEKADIPALIDPARPIAAGEFLEYHVTARPVATAEQLDEAHKQGWRPRYSGKLRVFSGNEFISACELQPTRREAELSYSFQVAAKYAAKSAFTFALTEGEAGDGISYWFYLQDFAEPR
jgi:hypothetical protein